MSENFDTDKFDKKQQIEKKEDITVGNEGGAIDTSNEDMDKLKLYASNILCGVGLITSPAWVGMFSLGTMMANDSGQGPMGFQSLAVFSLFSSPVAMLFSLGHNILYKKYNPLYSRTVPIVPIITYIISMGIFGFSLERANKRK